MQKTGIKHFRYSISWPRVLPQGTGAVTASVMHLCCPANLQSYSRPGHAGQSGHTSYIQPMAKMPLPSTTAMLAVLMAVLHQAPMSSMLILLSGLCCYIPRALTDCPCRSTLLGSHSTATSQMRSSQRASSPW